MELEQARKRAEELRVIIEKNNRTPMPPIWIEFAPADVVY